MGKSCPKELFKIARCFRSYFVSLFESFQKVTERSRMLVTIQTRILNTFSKQGTKIIQGNIMCVSHFHMDMFGNVLKFWCYDPTFVLLAKADSIVFPPNITFWLTVAYCLQSFLLLAIGNKPLSLWSCHEAQNTFFVIQVIRSLLFCFVFLLLFSRREKKRKDYYRYLRQWIIEIFIITQLYKLCTKRETKVEIALPRKITWLRSVNLCGIRSCLTDKMNREYNIL